MQKLKDYFTLLFMFGIGFDFISSFSHLFICYYYNSLYDRLISSTSPNCKYLQYRKNTLEVINGDPLLSYFKSHFVIRKVYFPRVMTIEYFADIVPEGFGLQKEFNNGVYIVQICHVYDE